jgi:hypothetical protein
MIVFSDSCHWFGYVTAVNLLQPNKATLCGIWLSGNKTFIMKPAFFLLLAVLLLAGCKKEHGSSVDIYMLKSFATGIDQSYTPPVNTITNAVLESTPLISDADIISYSKDSRTFTLRRDVKNIIQNYGPDKAFAIAVDNQVIYYGAFHPAYLSSLRFGLATIDPILISNKELKIDFVNITGLYIHPLDKRNDDQLLHALKITGRLK